MRSTIAPLYLDSYKIEHPFMIPTGTNRITSNLTPRKTRRNPSIDGVVACGFQFYTSRFLIEYWNEFFFKMEKEEVLRIYKKRVGNYPGPSEVKADHIAALHDLGYLPIHMKAIAEGTIVPFRVPVMTITNTHDDFPWLVNMLETQMSNILWMIMTSATTALEYRKVFKQFAEETSPEMVGFVPWQAHDFSMRGLPGLDACYQSGMGHLFSNFGSDNVPAFDALEWYYGADVTKMLVGGSVPATEHMIQCMGTKEGERETYKRLITQTHPTGIISIVSDTWDLWNVMENILPSLKSEIMGRDGKLVVRPDSGDPVDILCGNVWATDSRAKRGVIQLLWDHFGGTTNSKGFKQLDPHVGAIYGDSITLTRQGDILSRLKAAGFASTNVVLGIGSYTYQYVTRDTDGYAMKATHGEINGVGLDLFKDPITDDGTKKSAKGLLGVFRDLTTGQIYCKEECSPEDEAAGLLKTIFINGKLDNLTTLAQIRSRIEAIL